eukprot:gene42012-52077_t
MVSDRFVDSIGTLIDTVGRLSLSETDEYFYTSETEVVTDLVDLQRPVKRIQQLQLFWSIEISSHIWFVSTHDNVSRCIDAIDVSSRRLPSEPVVTGDDTLQLSTDGVLADPAGNAPLKLHVFQDTLSDETKSTVKIIDSCLFVEAQDCASLCAHINKIKPQT